MKKLILTLGIGTGLALICQAGGLEDLAASIRADYASVQTDRINAFRNMLDGHASFEAVQHDYDMSRDMMEREQQVLADKKSFAEHLAKWREGIIEMKQKAAAEELARAKVEAQALEKKRLASSTWIDTYGPYGATSVRYDGLGQPTDKIDTYYKTNGDVTTIKSLDK